MLIVAAMCVSTRMIRALIPTVAPLNTVEYIFLPGSFIEAWAWSFRSVRSERVRGHDFFPLDGNVIVSGVREEGFSAPYPDHPTASFRPLIYRRIRLH